VGSLQETGFPISHRTAAPQPFTRPCKDKFSHLDAAHDGAALQGKHSMFITEKPAVIKLQDFLRTHSEGLQSASLLLGGIPALNATNGLIDDICEGSDLTRRLRHGLVRLNHLLSLEFVHELYRPEAAYFADLDPGAPYVEDICLLSEALKDILFRLDQEIVQPVFLPLMAT